MTQTLIYADGLIDGTGAPRIQNAAILVDGERIAAVGTRDQVPAPEGARTIELSGTTLLPGYVDSHYHVSSGGGRIRDAAPPTEATLAFRTARNMRIDLKHGITTARCMGEPRLLDIASKNAIEDGLLVGPRLLIGAYGLRPTFGHGYQGTAVDGVELLRAAVRENLRLGATHIKVFSGGGISDSWTELERSYYREDELVAIADEAHRLGVPTTTHAKGGEAARLAVASGFDCVEHGYTVDNDLLDFMIKKNTWLSLTPLAVFHSEGCPPTLPSHPVSGPKYRYARESHERNLPCILSSGIRYALGSDGRRGLFGHMFEYLVNAGASPVRAIQAGTLDSATLSGVDDQVGTLTSGKYADIIAVQGDPSEDIGLMKNSRLVALGGKLAEEVL